MAAGGDPVDYGDTSPGPTNHTRNRLRLEACVRGIVRVEGREPLARLPDGGTCESVCLKCVGGVGDVVMAIGGGAAAVKRRWPDCEVTAAVRDGQVDLLAAMEGVDGFIDPRTTHRPEVRFGFDVLVDFAGTFNASQELRRGGYHALASERLGAAIGPGRFKYEVDPQPGIVAVHAGASNPNRRWPEDRWMELADRFPGSITWFGTSTDPGRADERSNRCWDHSTGLLYQLDVLRMCEFFVGNDSGFAHLAGVLGIPGVVLFGVTHPDDVIDRYPTLEGIHNFTDYDEPTRSTRIDDERGRKLMDSITVDQVLDAVERGRPGCLTNAATALAS